MGFEETNILLLCLPASRAGVTLPVPTGKGPAELSWGFSKPADSDNPPCATTTGGGFTGGADTPWADWAAAPVPIPVDAGKPSALDADDTDIINDDEDEDDEDDVDDVGLGTVPLVKLLGTAFEALDFRRSLSTISSSSGELSPSSNVW